MTDKIKTFSFGFEELTIDADTIMQFMGYEKGQAPEPIPQLVEQTMLEAHAYCDIRGGYVHVDAFENDRTGYNLSLDGQSFYVGKTISTMFKKAGKACIFLCTAGRDISQWSHDQMHGGDMMKGYIIDVIGSTVVESAIERIHDLLEEDMKSIGLGVTNRFSPGYCDWPVKDQPILFSFFPKDFCGITLRESCLMDPIKSVSGIIGIGEEVRRKGYTCNLCDLENCIYRRK